MKTINKTEGLCDKCLKRVPARTFEQDGAVFIEKNCDEHGKFVALHAWDDPDIHKGLVKISTLDSQPAQVVAALTYKCNLNCRVCYARANEVDVKDLKIEDLDKINDYPIVFLSGGEPTFRPDLPAIISQLKSKGKKIVMFSNGLKLANRKYTRLLKEAGLRCVILQFDTVDDGECEYIRGKKIVNIKRKAIKNMQATGLPVYLYCTMIKNRSVERMKEIFDFAAGYSVIRAISVNPLWELGRYTGGDFVPSSKILEKSSAINGLKKQDWLLSTALLCSLDKLASLFSKNKKRLFCKCNLKCLVLRDRGKTIPVTKIFNVEEIIQKIEKAYQEKSRVKALLSLSYFLGSQLFLNSLLNRNFRRLAVRFLKNLRYLPSQNYLLLNPFHFVTIAIFPTPGNLDFDFADECNFNAISSEDFSLEPACIHRIKALKTRESQ